MLLSEAIKLRITELNIELKDFFNAPYFKDVEAIDRFEKNDNNKVS